MITYREYIPLLGLYIGLGEQLPAKVQEFKNNLIKIGALDLSDKKIQLQIPEKFWETAVYHNINLFPEDLKYINDVMKKDKFFNLKYLERDSLDPNEKNYRDFLFYEHFQKDTKCPKQLEKVLSILTGTIKGSLKEMIDLKGRFRELWEEHKML